MTDDPNEGRLTGRWFQPKRKRGGKGKGRGVSRAKANRAKRERLTIDDLAQNCPACKNPIIPPHASMSRYVNLFICSGCGIKEAAKGFFWADIFEHDKPTQPANYQPWG